jgi:SPP1 family phage portal protein
MELTRLIELIKDPNRLISAIQNTKTINYEVLRKQYDPMLHDVILDQVKYPDKTVKTSTGTKVVFVTRLAVPFQEMIVSLRATFLCGNPIELNAPVKKDTVEAKLLEVIQKTWDDNKLDYDSKTLAKLMMSETDAAELWFSEEAPPDYWKGTPNEGAKVKLRVRLLANSLGDSLYPIFDKMGDMVAFARGYTLMEEGKKEEHFDIYTDTDVYVGLKVDNVFTFEPAKKHGFLKIPVIYYSQPRAEWYNVQNPIDRLEMSISRHGNANDYMGFPLMAVYGKIISFADKGDDGKVIEVEQGGKIEMVVWPQAPESVKLEQQNLWDIIYVMSSTPKLSGEDLTAAGNYSGAALKMRFMPCHMKAAEKEEIFGKSIQRRLNFLKSAMSIINQALVAAQNLQLKPKFKYFLPSNVQEEINILTQALLGDKPILSQETAIDLNPLVEDKEGEKERLQAEKDKAQQAQEALNNGPEGLNNEQNNPLNKVA